MLRMLLLFISVCWSQGAFAQVYLGGTAGVSDTFIEGDDEVLEYDSDLAYRVYVGNRLSRTFAVEVAYVDYTEYDVVPLIPLPDTITSFEQTLAVSGFDVSFVGSFPFNSRLAFFSRIGAFVWDAELESVIEEQQADGSTLIITETPTTEDVDVSLGLGFNYRFMRNLGMTLEANTHRSDTLWNIVYGGGVYFTF